MVHEGFPVHGKQIMHAMSIQTKTANTRSWQTQSIRHLEILGMSATRAKLKITIPIENQLVKQQTEKFRPQPTKMNSFMLGPSMSLAPWPNGVQLTYLPEPIHQLWYFYMYFECLCRFITSPITSCRLHLLRFTLLCRIKCTIALR